MKKQYFSKLLMIITAMLIIALSLSACFKTREDIEKEREQVEMQQTLNKNIYEQSEGLQQAQVQIGKVQGKLEEAEMQRKKEQEEHSKMITSLNEKIVHLEEKLINSEKVSQNLLDEIKTMKQESIKQLSQSKVKKNPSEAKSNYKNGVEALSEKKYKEAADFFESYVEQNPKSKNFIKANYYLGQANYYQKKFPEAIVAFSLVFEKAANDPLWKKATLRIAESFQKIGKKQDAKPFAQSLIDRFPTSTEAKEAKKFLH